MYGYADPPDMPFKLHERHYTNTPSQHEMYLLYLLTRRIYDDLVP